MKMKGYRRHVRFYVIMRRLLYWPARQLLHFHPAPAATVVNPYIVVANHNTDFDAILLGLSFPKHMYYVASEHIFRTEWLRKLMIFFLDPIPKRKGGADLNTAMQMARRLRKGYNIALFAEGNKSFHGETCPVHPATGAMVKAAGAALITYRLEGGYFTSPRWAHTLRRGEMSGHVINEYPPEAIAKMTAEEINAVIAKDIYENAYLSQTEKPVAFHGKRLAEGIQNALYLCPSCHTFDSVEGKNDQVFCRCGLKATYADTGFLTGEDTPFHTLEEWGRWQRGFLRELAGSILDRPLFSDADQTILKIFPDHHTEAIANGTLSIGWNGLACGAFRLPLVHLQGLEIYGKNTIVFSDGEENRYQVLSRRERSGLKYFEAFEILRKERG